METKNQYPLKENILEEQHIYNNRFFKIMKTITKIKFNKSQ